MLSVCGSSVFKCVRGELYTVTQAAVVEFLSLSKPIAGFPCRPTVHVLAELNSQIPAQEWNMTLSQDTRAIQHYTHLTHTLIITLPTGFSKQSHQRCTNTGVHTLTLCFLTISSVCALSPGGCGIYSIHELLLFITSAQQMFGVISAGIWQSACPFKYLAYLSFLTSGAGIKQIFVPSTHYKQHFLGYFIRLFCLFWPATLRCILYVHRQLQIHTRWTEQPWFTAHPGYSNREAQKLKEYREKMFNWWAECVLI